MDFIKIFKDITNKKISYEAGKRPKKANRSGSGNYCCGPNCKNTQDNKVKIKTDIVTFHFPKTPNRRKESLQSIFGFRRRGGKDKFSVNNAAICAFHFDSDDVNGSMRQVKKTIKRSVVPTFEDMKKPVK